MQKKKAIIVLAMAAAIGGTTLTAIPMTTFAASTSIEQSTQIKTKDVKYGKLSKSDKAMLREMFDAKYYAEKNPDVVKAFGNSEEALFNHFCNFGIFEQRMANADFNVAAYASAYGDLQKAFGGDIVSYYKHYNSNGKNEKRSLTTVAKCAKAGISVYSVGSFQKGQRGAVAGTTAEVTPAQYTKATGEATPGNPVASSSAPAAGGFAGFVGGTSSAPSTPAPSTPVVNYTKTEVVDAEEATTQQLKEGVVQMETPIGTSYVKYTEVDEEEAVGTVTKSNYTEIDGKYYELTPATKDEATEWNPVYVVGSDDKIYVRTPAAVSNYTIEDEENFGGVLVDGTVKFYSKTESPKTEAEEGYILVGDSTYCLEVSAEEAGATLNDGYGITDEGVYYSTGVEIEESMAYLPKDGYLVDCSSEGGEIVFTYYQVGSEEVDAEDATEQGIKEGYLLDGDTYKKMEFIAAEDAFETVVKDGYSYNEETGEYTHEVAATEEEATTRVLNDGYEKVIEDEVTKYFKVEEVDITEALNFITKDDVYFDEEQNAFFQLALAEDDEQKVLADNVEVVDATYNKVDVSDEEVEGYTQAEDGKWYKLTEVDASEALDEEGVLKEGYEVKTATKYYAVGEVVADAYEDVTNLKEGYGKTDDDVYYITTSSKTSEEFEALDEEVKANYVEVDGTYYEKTTVETATTTTSELKAGLTEINGNAYNDAEISEITAGDAFVDDTEHFVQIDGVWYEIGAEITDWSDIYSSVTEKDGYRVTDNDGTDGISAGDSAVSLTPSTEAEATHLELNPGFSSDAE